MSKLRRIAALLAVSTGLSGCLTANVTSDARIESETAGIIGVSPSEVSISDRRTVGVNTYYTARAGQRSWSCVMNGGNVMTFGLTNPPSCTPR